MNRTDRLLAIVLELQGRGRVRAQDLAAHFETSKRTIYRDVEALCEAGVPIVATPGQGYALMEGYFLPPLSFSAEEATTLLLGGDFVAAQFDPQYRAVAATACRKIEAVLPARQRAELRELRESLHIVTPELARGPSPLVPQLLGELRRAILERHTVRFRYHGRHAGEVQEALVQRYADPYSLAHVGGAWYLVAHDHQRGALRKFRLDRLEGLVITADTFVRPSNFRLPEEGREDDRRVTVRALFAEEAARWVRESRYFYIAAQEETPEGLLVTLRVRREDDVVAWLLGWGRQARVLEPLSLRQRLADEAVAIARQYQEVAAPLVHGHMAGVEGLARGK
jgi:predicted DNA-binding transcriptional regulator YafY